MTELEKLEEFACQKNYLVFKSHINSDRKGICVTDFENPIILLNKSAIENDTDEFCTLAEEAGHLETGAVLPVECYFNPEFSKWLKRRNEIRAERWRIKRYLPASTIKEAINNFCFAEHEIAEYCGVTVELLRKALAYHRSLGIQL